MSPRSMRAAAMAALLLLAACRGKEQRASSPADAVNRVTTRAVVLYFEGDDGLLTPEQLEMPLPESEAAAIRPLLAALIAGPKTASVPRLFPEGTIVRGAFILPEGTAVVDLGGREIQEGWNTGSHAELTAAYAIVQTVVANLPSVRRMQILVGGELAPTLAGHLDLSRPLRPHPDFVVGATRRAPAAPVPPAAVPPAKAP